MGKLSLGDLTFDYLWASDVDFDGIRLEVYDRPGNMLFEVSMPDDGRAITVNSFGNDVPADLIEAALAMGRARAAGDDGA